jgi:hypothetical protein
MPFLGKEALPPPVSFGARAIVPVYPAPGVSTKAPLLGEARRHRPSRKTFRSDRKPEASPKVDQRTGEKMQPRKGPQRTLNQVARYLVDAFFPVVFIL